MLGFTLIFRHSDALPLSADVEGASGPAVAPMPGTTDLKHTAKSLLRRLSPGAQGGLHSNNYFSTGGAGPANHALLQIDFQSEATFVVLLDRGVLFLTVNVASGCVGSPGSTNAVSLAAAYLEEVAREFGEQFGDQVVSVTRPFPFLRFDNFLSKTKKVFAGRGSQAGEMRRAHNGVVAQVNKASFYKIMGLVEPAGSNGGSTTASGLPPISVDIDGMSQKKVWLVISGVILFFLLFFWLIWRTLAKAF